MPHRILVDLVDQSMDLEVINISINGGFLRIGVPQKLDGLFQGKSPSKMMRTGRIPIDGNLQMNRVVSTALSVSMVFPPRSAADESHIHPMPG